MKIINRARASGKTTMLINTAYTTDTPIITADTMRARAVEAQANKMGLKGIRVYSVGEYVERGRFIPPRKDSILIDEVEPILELVLKNFFHSDIIACTMSMPMTELPKKEEVKTNDN